MFHISPDFKEVGAEPKRKRTTRIWIQFRVFDRKKDAKNAVSSQNIWSKSSMQQIFVGEKVVFGYFRGKYRKARKAECPAGMY